jgi:hypothetical protein
MADPLTHESAPPNSTPGPLPATVAWLGYGGLLPFIALAAIVVVTGRVSHGGAGMTSAGITGAGIAGASVEGASGDGLGLLADRALVAYGAVILSFVGALHWGFAMTLPNLREPRRRIAFIWSVVPALLAWVGLLLAPALGAALMIVAFLAQYAQDRNLSKHGTLPGWYLPLRLRLTGIACVCLAIAVVGAG